MVHHKGTQSPREAQTQQDVKDIAANGVRHRHVPHAWRKKGLTGTNTIKRAQAEINGDSGRHLLPCRATIRLAMQSGTLVPAARKVMPMM